MNAEAEAEVGSGSEGESEAVVVAENLRKTYGDTVAVAGVSLSVERGEVFALIGPNGAGKTTLIRTLTGTSVPDGGSASVLGSPPTDVDRDRLGVLPQDFSPPARLTARELLTYYAGLYEDARAPDTVLEEVGLVDSADTWYENLSGGQQRRVCVGATLVNDPAVCVLDEPTTGIDPAGRRTVWRLIESLTAAGTTVLLTTHDMAEARRLGDRVGLLAGGELVAVGTPEELIADHAGSSRVVLETDAEPAAFADLAFPVESAGANRGRTRARDGRGGGGSIVVRDVSPADIATVVAFLEERGIEYSGLTWTEPDLEDVYLALADDVERAQTGRAGDGAESGARTDTDAERTPTAGGER